MTALPHRYTGRPRADVAELVDAHGSGPCARKGVEVQVLSSAWKRRLLSGLALLAAVLTLATAGGGATAARSPAPTTHVVVELERGGHARFEEALADAIPAARIHWRYRLTLNGVSVLLPARALGRLRSLPGVARVYPSTTYRSAEGPDATGINASALAATGLASGEGVKIGFIDDGIDVGHAFFDAAGYTFPEGFPKGQRRYTSAKLIVARAFPPPEPGHVQARLAYDAGRSRHGTHVAGIAAGNADTEAYGTRISGIAPRAWIGSYRALTIPTAGGVGLDGNAPEIVAAIEAGVQDGMDVLNLSIGEPEIEPAHDVVVRAVNAAVRAGVVVVVAAGNEGLIGAGTVGSPGTAEGAITVGAANEADAYRPAGFSARGPAPLSLHLKPDLLAPGTGILSSSPSGWDSSSGTSMAAPHVAGAAAILLERHPDWTPADVKAALVAGARAIPGVGVLDGGAGVLDLAAADAPLVGAAPTSVSFGIMADGEEKTTVIALRDLGGGSGEWLVQIEAAAADAAITAPAAVAVPGTLLLTVRVNPTASDGDVSGVVVLSRAGVSRRLPFWGFLATQRLNLAAARRLPGPGTYAGDTRTGTARVSTYRYPLGAPGARFSTPLAGPEQAFAVEVTRPVANIGVVLLSRGQGVTVEPRVIAGSEHRLTGHAALPVVGNPYLAAYDDAAPVAAALAPTPGVYHVVFDSPTRAGAGPFRFRVWVDDISPPTLQLLGHTVRRGAPLRVRATDSGAGVYPGSIVARVDGQKVKAQLHAGVVELQTATLTAGTHRLRLQASDWQEAKNTENVARILPNTAILTVAFTVRD